MSELNEQLLVYTLCGLPGPLLVWAWLRWRKPSATPESRVRRWLTVMALIITSMSWLTLVLFPDALGYFATNPGDPSDIAYIRAIQVGFFAALTGLPLAVFTAKRMRLILVLISVLLICLWFVAGQSV
jgi:hypothetical protein